MSPPTYAMAGEQLIQLLAEAAVRARLDRRPVIDTADLVAVLARRRILHCRRSERRRLWARLAWCDVPAEPASAAAIDFEASAALREAQWIAHVPARWCGCAHRVVRRALREASDVRVADAHGAHLLAAITGDHTSCGYRVLAEVGLSPREIQPTVLAAVHRDGRVRAPALTRLADLGALSHPPPKPGRRLLGRHALRQIGATGPVAYAIGGEAARQAVRADADEIGAVHVLAGICAIGFQHRRTHWVYAPGLGDHDEAAGMLARHGLEYPEFSLAVARTDPDPGSWDRFGPWRLDPGDPGWAPSGRAVLRFAQSYVDFLGHAAVGGDHLLMGCIEVDSAAVRTAVTKAGADYEALRTQAARLLIASP